jgi:hypothetical protein
VKFLSITPLLGWMREAVSNPGDVPFYKRVPLHICNKPRMEVVELALTEAGRAHRQMPRKTGDGTHPISRNRSKRG